LRDLLASLERRGTKRTRDSMVRYGIVAPKAFGVPVGTLQQMAKRVGRDHALADALWKSGWYEARLLASFVDEPARVTAAQMDRWCREFDNWGVCDTVCFHLFDRTPHAWRKAEEWCDREEEFVKRAAFALMASLALHDKSAADAPFIRFLPLIDEAAEDDRNFVKKGVSWALRSIGMRSEALHDAALASAKKLAASSHASTRWVGKDVLRGLSAPATLRRLAARRRRAEDSD
jgi:3-methyladenine DNA glycosylase AlkD